MLDTLKIKLQYLLPKQCLTQLAGRFANKKLGWLTQLVIKAFAKAYKVDMQEAKESEFIAYSTYPRTERGSPPDRTGQRNPGTAGRRHHQSAGAYP